MALDADALRARAVVLQTLRAWMHEHGYLEMPTPCIVPSPGLEESLYSWQVADGWLRTSPEFALKRTVSAGLPRVYELGPSFRSRESGPWHRGEFLMLEWYRAGACLADLMAEVEQLVHRCAVALHVPAPGPWRRVTVRELFEQTVGVDLADIDAVSLCAREPADWNAAFFRRWLEDVEPTLTGATFVEAWPAAQAALATVRTDGDWPIAERFEAFLGGVELANAFHELVDPVEQRRRFDASSRARTNDGELPHPVDERFIDAIGHMPRASGIAMGVDRLVAALCGWTDIDRGWVT